jgi:hypothetical protein
MIEAMKQALEALETTSSYATAGWVEKAHREAITSLRQAIAEAEKQEPVRVTIKDFVKAVEGKEEMVGRPVYWAQWPNDDTHPQPKREWVGLTVMEAVELELATNHPREFAAAIEAKLKEKNFE